jgi:glycosyltransferase involved in cell wall biosynthesis
VTPGPGDQPLNLAFLGDPNSIHTRRWTTFFLDRGHSVHLILAGDRPVTESLDSRLVVHRMRPQSRSPLRFLSALRTRQTLRRILRQSRVDVLHAHYLTGYGWLARLSGFHPYVITVWGSDVYVTPRTSLIARAWAWASLRAADLVTADSADLQESVIRLGAQPSRSRLIQFGVDTSKFRPNLDASRLRAELRLEGRRTVFVPRAITPLYRTLTVVRAFSSLPDDCILVLTVYNHSEPYLAEVRSEATRLGLDDRVRFLAGIDHDRMPDAYSVADVVVSIPESDGTPVSLLEAMACGRPVVATDLPSVREWLGGIADWALVNVGDEPGTAMALRRALMLDPQDAEVLGLRFRGIVVERADYVRNMELVEAEYRGLAGT